MSHRCRVAILAALLLTSACAKDASTPSDAGTTTTVPAATTTAAGSSEIPPTKSTCAPGSTTPSTELTPAATAGTAAADTLTATQAFLAGLDATQKSTVLAERTAANLAQWSNLPDQLFKRAGLRMDTLSTAQKTLVKKVLESALSSSGYAQVTQISAADGVLAAAGGMNLDFGADHYWIRVLGTPAATGKWTIQYGGHHLALNITLSGKDMTLAPTLWGAQPASYTAGGTPSEPLCGETVQAFALIDALDATQQKAAILTTPVKEIVLGAGQDGKTLAQEGVKASTFTSAQKQKLLDLIDEWITPLNGGAAAAKLAEAQRNLDDTTFAWYGATTIGQPVYYRVQGPTFTIEFAHQQGQGANAGGITHIHSIYREPENDYGSQLGT
ncbi:DUF3500 domain-containing protein [Actinokineospora enzanensis]|uniref:DUF3500 domain-containing protein n=1 Tax=Actinokineospora enzanensis TaxID=155975 RepID=UPI000360F409|nr:DUF3500 domain-containing protein [Actinokineospora enzanensis]